MWAALEVISMYQHGRPELDPEIERLIKRITTASPLLDGERQSNRDGYLVGHLIELVRKHGRLDAAYALDLWHQLIGLCQVKDHSVFQALDDSARKMIPSSCGRPLPDSSRWRPRSNGDRLIDS
jgi:hypothetical protein